MRVLLVIGMLTTGLFAATAPAAATHSCSDAVLILSGDPISRNLDHGDSHWYHQPRSLGLRGTDSGTATLVSTSGNANLHIWTGGCGHVTCASAQSVAVDACTFDPTFGHKIEVRCFRGPCSYVLTVTY